MGYRSEVCIAVETPSADHFQRLVAGFDPDKLVLVMQNSKTTEDGAGIRFHHDNVKWYSSALIGYAETGYEVVNAFEDFLTHAENLSSDFDLGEEGGVPSAGLFIRIGEEGTDIDERTWHSDAADLPYPYDLAHVSIAIVTDW